MTGRSVEFLFGESAGRIEVPLPDLPSGVKAYTVPKPRPDDDLEFSDDIDRVPRDRRGRVKPRQVDLLPAARAVPFCLPSTLSKSDLKWVLRTKSGRLWTGVVAQFGDRAWEAAAELVRSGVAVLRCSVDGFDYRPHVLRLTEGWQAARLDHLNELTGRQDPEVARATLAELLEGVRELSDELGRLKDIELGAALRAPVGSRTGTTVWSVFEDAVRGACYWYSHDGANTELTAKQVASEAFRDSKRWTPERETAFANLVGRSFTEAVKVTDVEILMRGPLRWHVGSVIADAHSTCPWIGLPAGGIELLGTVDQSDVRGVFVIENKDAFEQVCTNTDIYHRWLCVWGAGYASRPLVTFLSAFDQLPIAAWCDLDADGIGIINNLSVRLGREIHPVAMDVEWWAAGPHRRQTPSELERGRARAARLAIDGPVALRSLAAAIAPTGDGREQESQYREVLPILGPAVMRWEP
ncbi:Wadjet anti-phage system protein JetD domain-containing protein [Amycolatopsis sp. lyj-90]|uniref:Wadjet anti-phage system protein JetD domain-containing protein n=1 Tax=Amycolatopsis sp. lyj-90 TaxID=2789285 RepID=UPI003978E380